ncbi:histidine biosynthesis trifunctional protein [Eremomyces bilateralis CBS 781.70]|uniref:Histidine biosynthesis trifunctional protein n=1 Tax=Eremomyces bilateralis CBS 781.70 TaxID=1392243 RepID=A0A6G1FRA4_9PEZI|nr:histidine biosynthesis trifunctional protein [Eremomyces bilateralis CBS 781.70]KAF1808219.1 histidine biosynthesis trifunctional protein [Eremomyces bilateralis CBS 781.70]
MASSLILHVDLSSEGVLSPQGIPSAALSYFGSVFIPLSESTLDAAFSHLQRSFGRLENYFDVTALESVEDIVSLLDAGAAGVFVSQKQLVQLERTPNIDLDRVTVVIVHQAHTKDEIIDSIAGTSVGVCFWHVQDVQLLEAWLKEYSSDRPPVYFSLEHPDFDRLSRLSILGGIAIAKSTDLTLEPQTNPGLVDAVKLLLSGATSDRPDGLFTTMVTDERGIALGLVYSSEESVAESIRTGRGVYQSRKRGLWYKGESSGDVQELVHVKFDCDKDCICFVVRQKGNGFCHLGTATCFGRYYGLSKLQKTLLDRRQNAPEGSYTARLFNDTKLLHAKIMEEANELCEAKTKEEVSFEAADLLYFAMTKCIASDVSLEMVERNLDAKSVKVKRRKGDAKGPWAEQQMKKEEAKQSKAVPEVQTPVVSSTGKIQMRRYQTSQEKEETILEALKRPSQRSSEAIFGIVNPIIKAIREGGDKAVLEYTHKFEKATSLTSPVLNAPFPPALMQLPQQTIDAIDISFENIRRFHAAQQEEKPLVVETMPGVICSRFSRPIERVGLYVPGGTAVLPSTALMLGVPAMVAGCQKIVLASPPRADGSITPEIVYVAHKVGAESIVLAGGAQAVAAMAYGTESVSKVDKILGPGNQFVTAAKMIVSNDTSAGVSIDMPAGPSEVLVIADATANPAFVASDLLSQAEHGADSQVVLIAVDLTDAQLLAIDDELHNQANALPRVDIVRKAIDHSVTLIVNDIQEAIRYSNAYAPEHLILQVKDAEAVVQHVQNAGSVFIGPWTPESVGDYSAGVNHSLPTYGYAKQYSGVNLGSYVKHITSANLTLDGLRAVGPAVMELARVEELEAHRRAVSIRLASITG